VERPPLFAQRAPTSRSSPLLLLLSKRDLSLREAAAKRAHSVRLRMNKRLNQAILMNHWPELRPVSFPVYNRTKAPPSLHPRNLPNMGWKSDLSHKIRLNLPKGGPFLFPHSPPGSPSQLRQGPPLPDSDCHRSTSTMADPNGITSPSAFSSPYLTILLAILQPPRRRP